MSAPTRYPNGVTNVSATNPLGQYGLPDPSKWHTYFNDFDAFTTGVTTMWTETAVGTSTIASTDIDGGAILFTTGATENNGVQLQKVPESFLLTAGKRTIFKARFKVSEVIQSDILIGLAVTDTTLLGAAAGDGVTDGIFFQSDDGSAALNVYCQLDTTTGQTAATSIATLVADTFLTVAWSYDGVSEVAYYVNDVQLGTLSATSTYLPNTELTISAAILTGEAGAKTMTLDYIFAAQER